MGGWRGRRQSFGTVGGIERNAVRGGAMAAASRPVGSAWAAALLAGNVLLAVLFSGCASEAPPAKAPEPAPAPPTPRRASNPGMKVSSELGELDERATDMAFQKAQSGLAQCFSEGLARVDYLSGEVSMFVRIGENGAAKIARLASSTLGDRPTETCMVSVLQRAAWPKPAGGEGEAKKTLTFDPPSDVRAPSSWPGDRVSSAVATHRGKLKSCQAEGQGRFSITAYVGPDSHHGGKVLAVGGASKAPEDDAKLDCVLDAIKEWKLPSPGSYAAKVTFSL